MTTRELTEPEVINPPRRPNFESEVTPRELYRRGLETAKELKGSTEEKIRARPIQTVLIAAGVGAAIGWLLGRRR